MFYTTTYDVSFDHMVNGTLCKVDARAYGDECDGVCKVEIVAVWFEGVDVAELLDDATYGEIESRIDDECYEDWANR